MSCQELNVLVIGATGAGKTSLINLFYCWSKNWDVHDIFSAKKVQIQTKYLDGDAEAEGDAKNQGESQTKFAKVYKFYLQVPGENTKYMLNFLDTPGVGDTRGIQYDEHNIDLIVETVAKTEALNAIILVLNGAESRNHSRIQYMLKKLQSIIPKEFTQNLILLLSNVDLEPNLNLKTAFDLQLEDKSVFWYNNQIFNLPPQYFNNKNILARSQQTYQDSIDTIAGLLREISSLPLIKTQGFSEIQDNRDRFKRDLINFGEIIYDGLIKRHELQQIASDIGKGETEVSQLKDKLLAISYQGGVWKTVLTNETNTLCCLCKETCHKNCALEIQTQGCQRIKDCIVFNYGRMETCQHCRHSFTSHIRLNEKYEKDEKETMRTCSGIQNLISELKKNQGSETAYIKALTSEIEKLDQERRLTRKKIGSLVDELRRVCSRFDHIKQIDNCITIFEEKALDVERNVNDPKKEIKLKAIREVQRTIENLKKYISEELKSLPPQNNPNSTNFQENPEGRLARSQTRGDPQAKVRAFSSGSRGTQNPPNMHSSGKKPLVPINPNLLTKNAQTNITRNSIYSPEDELSRMKKRDLSKQREIPGPHIDQNSILPTQPYSPDRPSSFIKKLEGGLKAILENISCLEIKNDKERREVDQILNDFHRESKSRLQKSRNDNSENYQVVLDGAESRHKKKSDASQGFFKTILGCKKGLR